MLQACPTACNMRVAAVPSYSCNSVHTELSCEVKLQIKSNTATQYKGNQCDLSASEMTPARPCLLMSYKAYLSDKHEETDLHAESPSPRPPAFPRWHPTSVEQPV